MSHAYSPTRRDQYRAAESRRKDRQQERAQARKNKNATTGTVTFVGRMGRWVDVTWDNGNSSTYDTDTLTIVERAA